ncbi:MULTISPECIES: amino acid ABC transporter permease [unclassified Pseudonocardia]|uniref:amino acid ABC transporter permease n=1 Tax=unclassified Pseudonocardia TaxID=2619320 RepID=UPI0001FFE863|nr:MULTISPECIES: amino acid ABC transporter permease [unclassified Pseudonocardia]ALE74415.1 amino acid ABC transporter permease [Pseudonocardia sp. EC080625-04]ALL77829.1 amino acid ABC transporter permease [Pseudonocardia sp. EC080610-09]ALL80745.1 amino acid ABC transporter permease [Pseudonocardia sp. EC080619-01]OLM17303.1 glutamate permease [Pseudonocardia sp. Ae707_Ps1]
MSSVLYDVPGPAAVRRNRALGVVGVAAVVAIVAFVLWRFYDAGQFSPRLWEWITYVNIQYILLGALWATVSAFLVAAVLSLVFGAVFAGGRLSDHRWVSGPATAIVEFFRAIPLLVLIFILYFGLSQGLGIDIDAFWAVVLGLMLYNGSVLAEVFRAGVNAVPRGQREAAYALGLRKTQVMTNVLLPQAFRSMLPTILSQLVVVLKDTALGFIILYPELLYQARFLGSQNQLGAPILPVAIVIAVIYIGLCLILTGLSRLVEKRLARGPRATSTQGPDQVAPAMPSGAGGIT